MARKSQVQKFRDTARGLECNESEVAFDHALNGVAKAPQPPKGSKTQPSKKPNRQSGWKGA